MSEAVENLIPSAQSRFAPPDIITVKISKCLDTYG